MGEKRTKLGLLFKAATGYRDGKLRQSELGRVIGVSQSTVSKLAAGELMPSDDVLDRTTRLVYGWDADRWEEVRSELLALRAARVPAWLSEEAEGVRERVADLLDELKEQDDAGIEEVTLRVDRMRPFVTHFVDVDDLGRDRLGRWWVDPSAEAHDPELVAQRGMVRIQRYDDGTVRLDDDEVARLERDPQSSVESAFAAWGPRTTSAPDHLLGRHAPQADLERHTLRVTQRRDLRDELLPIYMSTIIDLHHHGVVHTVRARDGAAGEEAVAVVESGGAEPGFLAGGRRIFVLTAENPVGRLLRRSDADERNRLLHDRLMTLVDGDEGRVLAATARSGDGLAPWQEVSFAVADIEVETARKFATDHGQRAFFEITRERFELHWSGL